MGSREFSEWIAFDRLDPIGSVRGDYQAALPAWITARYQDSKGSKFKLEDFVLDFDAQEKKAPEPMSHKAIWDTLFAGTKMAGGTVN